MTPPFWSRSFRRRLGLGLRTLLGARPGGFFIPYRYADQVAAPAFYDVAADICAAAVPDFRRALSWLGDCRAGLQAIADQAPPPAPRWGQEWFPPLDAAMLYAIIRARKPALLLEVGSGHSTRFAARAIADGRLATRHVAIDPAPRADIRQLPVALSTCVLAAADPALFDALRAGDILFIDSSHILMPGTDVDQLFNRLLPRLAAGVIVHVHDIFLPDGYPDDWHWRGYNEQQGLLPLLSGGTFRPIFASRFALTRMKDDPAAAVIDALPGGRAANALASSFWMVRL